MHPQRKTMPAILYKNDELVVLLVGSLVIAIFIACIWQYLVSGLALLGAVTLYREANRR